MLLLLVLSRADLLVHPAAPLRHWQVGEGSGLRKGNTETRSSWLNCALRDDEALYWVSIGHYEAVAVDN